ncbi:histidine ammonia-lyase [Leptobacterium sp. I13]|uniref:histidine ammonia-lyase n=1 Tax=Leptobacterium meishanense TaxID=3128904 RepID=UPI0030EF6F33
MKKGIHYISSDILDIATINGAIDNGKMLALSDEAKINIEKCKSYLDNRLSKQKEPVYGINTGFGSLCNVKISKNHLAKLQENLVMSHACGMGEEVPARIVKIMLFLKIQSLSYGHSGVQLATVNKLIDFFNNGIYPVVYTQGSLGASGDLAPLAHLALPLIGKGEVYYEGKKIRSEELLKKLGWEPIGLQAKEGLALLNGTQFMSAYGVTVLSRSYKLSHIADIIGSMSLDAYLGRLEPFDKRIHHIRPHGGQIKTAEKVRRIIEGSKLSELKKHHVQDPYSFRCIPQVHGATKDTLDFVQKTFKTEINSVTDNPNIFEATDAIISGGNFHGQPLALALDYLAIAMAELGSISERRTFHLISGSRGLPTFLVNDPGLNSGLMIPQYTAASIVSENKQLATPASVDSIVSSNGQEDHVSMGANAATKCKRIVDNVEKILAIELMSASQALVFREPVKTAPYLEKLLKKYRESVGFIANDRILHTDIVETVAFLRSFEIEEFFLDD